MAGQERVNRIPIGVVAGISVAVLAAASAAWLTINSVNPPRTPPPVATTTPVVPLPLPSPVSPPEQQKAQIYWLKDTGSNLKLVSKSVIVAAQQPNAVLEAAFDNLLAGSTDTAMSSAIPEGTKLRSVKIKKNGIHVDLSQEFTTGGGSASMIGRVAQVLYTATAQEPNAKVWIDVEGKPLTDLGGEGLELDQPMTRQSFKENFTL